jgi:hypothetical protein
MSNSPAKTLYERVTEVLLRRFFGLPPENNVGKEPPIILGREADV